MKSPAFRFYPSDFWASPDVQAMDLHEVGAYLSLMSAAWLSDRPGCLPDDDDKLRRWARMTREQWSESRATLLQKFPIQEDGVRRNPRLYREAEKAESFRVSQSEKGRKGGRPKAGEKPGVSNQNPGLSVGLSPEKPSVSVSVSASVSKEKKEREPFAHASQAPLTTRIGYEQPKAVKAGKRRSETFSAEAESVWAAYPLKKGKAVALPIIKRIVSELRGKGIDGPADLLIERIQCWLANRANKQARGEFVPEIPYPQKFFKRGDWDDEDSKPTPKVEFVEVPDEQWLGGDRLV